MSVFSLIAIIVGCLGLLGLVTFTTRLRMKEIGIRKVLGSSPLSIVSLLVRNFLGLFVVSSLIAWTLTWMILQDWLENFAFHINLKWYWFLLAAVMVAAIAMLTISIQVLKAANANPVQALRHE